MGCNQAAATLHLLIFGLWSSAEEPMRSSAGAGRHLFHRDRRLAPIGQRREEWLPERSLHNLAARAASRSRDRAVAQRRRVIRWRMPRTRELIRLADTSGSQEPPVRLGRSGGGRGATDAVESDLPTGRSAGATRGSRVATGETQPDRHKARTPAVVTLEEIFTGRRIGAGEGIRTLDPNLGKVVLYP